MKGTNTNVTVDIKLDVRIVRPDNGVVSLENIVNKDPKTQERDA